ncbi:MAG: cytochrome c [Rhodocyclales bacterium GT-UBC]|nr:MAG: cytochrome c [Rhodocyclales bacterium GT-UBC]
MTYRILALSIATLLIGNAYAAPLKPEDQIKIRKAGYSFMAWNMGKIKANIDGNFNKDEAAKAAAAIAAISNSGMGALYGAGTDKDIGDTKTRVKAEFFQEQDKVRELAGAFNKEANELAKVAAGGELAALRAQFGKTGETCKACHDKFRKEDH